MRGRNRGIAMREQNSEYSYEETVNGNRLSVHIYDDREPNRENDRGSNDLDCRSFLDDITFDESQPIVGEIGKNYGMWMLSRSDQSLSSLKEDLLSISESFVANNSIKIRASTIEGIVNAAIYQVQHPECPSCGLAGCESCNGLGRVRVSNGNLCSIIGITHKSLLDSHISIFNHLVMTMNAWHKDICEFFAEELGEVFE